MIYNVCSFLSNSHQFLPAYPSNKAIYDLLGDFSKAKALKISSFQVLANFVLGKVSLIFYKNISKIKCKKLIDKKKLIDI